MKRAIIFLLFLQITFFGSDKRILEEVSVTNVEVPVRVMHKGKPVLNMTKSNFKLFENGIEQEIEGFYQVSKRIKKQSFNLLTDQTKKYQSRYFVLVFRIYKVTEEIEKAINHTFKNILHQNDKLLLFINNKTLFFDNLIKTNEIIQIIKNDMKEESRNASIRFEKAYQKIRHDLSNARFQSGLDMKNSMGGSVKLGPLEAKRFLENYEQILKEYRKRFLTPDINIYYNFAKHLQNIALEKWVITFYQFEKFPIIKLSGRLRMELGAKLDKIDRQIRMIDDFPSEEIAKIFYKVNTTFHSLFFTTYENINSRDLEFGEISTDLENSFREITKRTGGDLIVSNKLEISLKKIEKNVDVYYMLTYTPKNIEQRGKIDVKLDDTSYKIYFDDNIRKDYISKFLEKKESKISEIRIENFNFKNKKLNFKITGIMQRRIKKELMGRIKIHLQIKDTSGKVLYDKSKDIVTNSTKASFNIGLSWMSVGDYDVILNIVDLFTYKSVSNYKKIDVL